jgi:hypothetical protein
MVPQPPTEWYGCKAQAHLAMIEEPATVKEALDSPNATDWEQAMNEEMASLDANGTWELVPLPSGAKPIPCKWIFKVKRDAHGNIGRFNARLVAKGFAQRAGIDYDKVYALVSKHTTLQALLATVASKDWHLHQLDVKVAFLNGEVNEEIYMQEGYPCEPGQVCHPKRLLYSLKQAPRAWHTKVKEKLGSSGSKVSCSHPGFFIGSEQGVKVFVLIYVDNMLIARESIEAINKFKELFKSIFTIRDMSEGKYFLGLEITRDRDARTLLLGQYKCMLNLIERFGMADAKKSIYWHLQVWYCRRKGST